MKKFVLSILTLAAVALFAQPVFAEHSHDHGSAVQATAEETAEPAGMMNDHESMMQESMQKMRAQMEKIKQTKDPKKRQKLLQEHSKSMRDSIKMMREMMAGMTMECASGGAMGGGNMMGGDMAGGHKKCDRMKSDPQANQPEGNAEAAPPVAQSSPDQAATIDKTPADAVKKLWSCPMHPDVVQDHPGTCPLCGMDLVEMEQPGAAQAEHSHTMDGGMSSDCMKGSGMKDGCMGGGMKGDHKMGGCMGGDCMKGGGMKDGCMSGGMGGGMMGDHKMGECMKGGRMGGDCMKGSGMKGGCMGGGMKGQMRKMTDHHMGMMLMLMEQMIEHDEAAMAVRK